MLLNHQKGRISLCWNNTCQDNRLLQYYLELILGSLQKRKHLDQATRKRNFFDLQKEYCAPGIQTHIADIHNRFCQEIEKCFCAGKVYPNTLYLENTRRNEINCANVITTITGEGTTHCNCSRIFHTFLQRNIGSGRDGEIHDG